MKRFRILMLVLLLVIIGFACETPTDLFITNDLKVSTHANTMITKGNAIFEEVFNSYKLNESTFAEDIKTHIDYTIFPEGYDNISRTNFWDRMSGIYYQDDPYQKVMDVLSGDPTEDDSFIFGVKTVKEATRGDSSRLSLYNVPSYRKIRKFLGNHLVIIGGFYGSTRYLVLNYPDHHWVAARNLSKYLKQLQKSLYVINQKIDTIIRDLSAIKKDINALQMDVEEIKKILVDKNLKDPLNAIDGFLRYYGELAVSSADQKACAESYTYEFERILLDFIDAILKMQQMVLSSTDPKIKYADTVYNEPQANVLKVQLRWNASTSYFFDFKNPRKVLNISLGNLEYLYKMIMTRFVMNQVLYEKSDELALANSNAAKLYLKDINDERFNIKESIAYAIKLMDGEYANHKYLIENSFRPLAVPAGTPQLYINDELNVEYTTSITDLNKLLDEVYASVYTDYIGIFLAKFIALEVELKAYITE